MGLGRLGLRVLRLFGVRGFELRIIGLACLESPYAPQTLYLANLSAPQLDIIGYYRILLYVMVC